VLDLGVPVRTVEGVELAADDEQPLAFHVLPPPPRVAFADGQPQLELLRFIRDGQLTGGHLRVLVELAHPPAVMRRATAALAELLRQDEDQLVLRPCPVEEASAELLFVGREPTADGGLSGIVARPYGRTAAQSLAPHAAAFAVTLTADGVRLIEAALRSGAAPIATVFRLQVEGLWPAQRVVAHIDWGRVYDHFSVNVKEGAFFATEELQRITETLIEERAIRINAVQGLVAEEGQPPIDMSPALQWIQRELVEKFCEPVLPLSRTPARASLGTFGDMFGVGSDFVVKKLTQIERATADVDFQQSRVLTRTLTVQAHLADLLGGAPAAAHIVDADPTHPFFERMSLHVRTARPLAQAHAGEVTLQFGYGTTSTAARLTAAVPEAHFETWANASPDRTWTLQPELTFSSDAPIDPGQRALLPALRGQGRELTLDLDQLLGLRRIEVRAPADARVLIATARLTRRRAGEADVASEVQFAAGSPPQTAWFRDCRPGDRIEVAAKYLLKDNRQISAPVTVADTNIVRLPPPFPGAMTVQLIADDDWTGIDRVIVAVQKAGTTAAGTYIFDKPGKVVDVSLEMPDPADRRFRYRVTRLFTSAVEENDEWVDTDVPVVIAGRVAANKLVVDVTPVGPELPLAGVRIIEVELSYIDAANQIRDIRKAVLQALVDTFHWEVTIKDPGRRHYEYRVTVHRTSGARTVGAWTRATSRLLPIPVTPA
jgi:hypothetical protein